MPTSHTEQLIARIRKVAETRDRATSTISAIVLGSGKTFSELEAGKTITLAKYEKALLKLDELERAA